MRIFEWLLAALMVFTLGFGIKHCAEQKLKMREKVINATPVSSSLFDTGYNFVELFQEERNLVWIEGAVVGLKGNILRVEAAFQEAKHYDIAAEVPLYWEEKFTHPVYYVFKHGNFWYSARVMGPWFKPFHRTISKEFAKAAARHDYMEALYEAGIRVVDPGPKPPKISEGKPA